MKEPRGQELIERYKKNYGIPADAPITEEMILRHWNLEKDLTQKLLKSTPENRFEIFEDCYSKLYSELEWLNLHIADDIPNSVKERNFQIWPDLIETPTTQTIYEVGSGKAELISFLSRIGYSCVASEITQERGEKYSEEGVVWKNSDGVHLGRFEQHTSYDVVISDQVIEHIHPDDTQDHFRGVHEILNQKGRYIFRVPHRFTGPHDISRVFKIEKAQGMHLREMTFREINILIRRAGFSKFGIVLINSRKQIVRLFSKDDKLSSLTYINIVILFERFIRFVPSLKLRLKAIRLISRIGFFPEIFVVATK